MDYAREIKKMINDQLIHRGISDPKILKAFKAVKRHCFVPENYAGDAYGDFPLPIGCGQTISQPYMVAIMTEILGLKGGEKVLEIGTGSGYQSAILAEIAEKVWTIEREKDLSDCAKKTLFELGYDNIEFVCGDGTEGKSDEAPFDRIIVTAGAPEVPEPLTRQLADGGRLVIPVGPKFSQILMAVDKKGEELIQHEIIGCVFVPLIGAYGWSEE